MQTKMGVRAYALRRGLEPQNVYYYIRTRVLELETCECCGAEKVLDIAEADKFFDAKDERERVNGEGKYRTE